MPPDEQQPVRQLSHIPGWFSWIDQRMFEHFLSDDALVTRGDLVEIGVYMGKSAALVGAYLHPGETFTVCDLFEGDAADESNRTENARSYTNLTRQRFERNYLSVHDELPVVVAGLSSTILDHVKPNSARFVHVDGSHLYDHVVTDIESARTMLLPDGVVVFDDYRSPHTPGVAAAVWEAMLGKGLQVICLTHQKMYATFGAVAAHQGKLADWLTAWGRVSWENQTIAGKDIMRMEVPPPKGGSTTDLSPVTAGIDELSKKVEATRKAVRALRRDLTEMSQRPSLVQRVTDR